MASFFDTNLCGMSSPVSLGDVSFNTALANICNSAASMENMESDQFSLAAPTLGNKFMPTSGMGSTKMFGGTSSYFKGNAVDTYYSWIAAGQIPFVGGINVYGPGAGDGGGSGAGAANGASNVGGAGNAGGAEETKSVDQKEITQEMKDEVIDQLQGMGYKKVEAETIVKKVAGVADGQKVFTRILADVPDKMQKDEAGKKTVIENWPENFGNWYAQNIGGLDGTTADELVKETALEPETPSKNQKKKAVQSKTVVTPNGVEKDNSTGKVYDVYDYKKVDISTGKDKSGGKLYFNDDTWYKKDVKKGYVALVPQPKLNDKTGALSFGKEVAYKPKGGYNEKDATTYISELDGKINNYKKKKEDFQKAKETQEKLRKETADQMLEELKPDMTLTPYETGDTAGESAESKKKVNLNPPKPTKDKGSKKHEVAAWGKIPDRVEGAEPAPLNVAYMGGPILAQTPAQKVKVISVKKISLGTLTDNEKAANLADKIASKVKDVPDGTTELRLTLDYEKTGKDLSIFQGDATIDIELTLSAILREKYPALTNISLAFHHLKDSVSSPERKLAQETPQPVPEPKPQVEAKSQLALSGEPKDKSKVSTLIKPNSPIVAGSSTDKITPEKKEKEAKSKPADTPASPPTLVAEEKPTDVQPAGGKEQAKADNKTTAPKPAVEKPVAENAAANIEPSKKDEAIAEKITPPTEDILREPYNIAGVSVDFILPDNIEKDLDKALPELKKEAEKQANKQYYTDGESRSYNEIYVATLLSGIADWAKGITDKWTTSKDLLQEILSLWDAVDWGKGECTERTNFLYAVMMQAKNSKVTREDLKGVTFDFEHVFNVKANGKLMGHVCLMATITGDDGKVKKQQYDIANPATVLESVFSSVAYQEFQEVDLQTYVASLLCNKGKDIVSTEKNLTKAKQIFDAAYELAPNNTFVVSKVAEFYYSMAHINYDKKKVKDAKTYATQSGKLWDEASKLDKWESVKSYYDYRGMEKDIATIKAL